MLKSLNAGVNAKCPNAAALMNISLTNPKNVKSNKEYTVSNNKNIENLRKNYVCQLLKLTEYCYIQKIVN